MERRLVLNLLVTLLNTIVLSGAYKRWKIEGNKDATLYEGTNRLSTRPRRGNHAEVLANQVLIGNAPAVLTNKSCI